MSRSPGARSKREGSGPDRGPSAAVPSEIREEAAIFVIDSSPMFSTDIRTEKVSPVVEADG